MSRIGKPQNRVWQRVVTHGLREPVISTYRRRVIGDPSGIRGARHLYRRRNEICPRKKQKRHTERPTGFSRQMKLLFAI